MTNKQKDLVPGPIDDIELGWLAGLLEGEGHFGYDRTQLCHVRMTDIDTIIKLKTLIERVFALAKPITLLTQNPGRRREQDTYGIQTYGATARGIMRLVVPLMGQRRRQQIWRSLNEFRPRKLDVSRLVKRG